ncbi:MAG: CBS domain-containing protein [Thermoplasmata archaeon]|uniref:CBS domain-containing protein n=1 Tax=Candidatus Sysuiplasma superficiale TaxID=2823368 RepID=A0A8J7YLW4_9ARCH|nr:CBS domain-containing protein [Candidatus Sysuiplasma superficiale]MBX8643198.1 CBS domain-containing protein [Candidatus Sysuiplasma superficiale]MCL4346717.1 CBS domain-containing protein [Candidatus Thermoplasmatota archaeon]
MPFPRIEDIKKMRKQLDMTQSQLAKAANVSQSTIAKLERKSISASYEIVTRVFNTLEAEGRSRKLRKTAKDVLHPSVVSVSNDSTLAAVSELMKKRGYSQLPVMSGESVIGSISEEIILNKLREGMGLDELSRVKVEEVMNDAYPVITEDTPVESVAALLTHSPAVLVQRKGKISGIITKSDLLKLI